MQLPEALGDLGQLRAGGHGHDHVVGRLPAELLDRLEGQGLGALGVVGAQVDVDERPRGLLRGQLGAQAVDVVVAAVDRDQARPVDRGGDDLARLEVGGDEHHVAHPGPGRVGGDGVGQVAGGGAGRHLEAHGPGPGQGHGHHPVLERPGGVQGVVLQPQLAEAELGGQAVGPHQRGEAGAQVDGAVVDRRQQVGVAPDRRRAGGDGLPRRGRGDLLVVVDDLEGAEAPLTDMERLGREGVAALPTPQALHELTLLLLIAPGIGTWSPPNSSVTAGCRGFCGPGPSTALDEGPMIRHRRTSRTADSDHLVDAAGDVGQGPLPAEAGDEGDDRRPRPAARAARRPRTSPATTSTGTPAATARSTTPPTALPSKDSASSVPSPVTTRSAAAMRSAQATGPRPPGRSRGRAGRRPRPGRRPARRRRPTRAGR